MSWLALLRRLPTKDRLRRWGMDVSVTCVLCSTGIETHHHLFFECPFSSSVWLHFASRIRLLPPMDLHSAAAWILNDRQASSPHSATLLKIIFQATIYLLWKERNARIFKGVSTTAEGIRLSIDRLARDRLLSFPAINSASASLLQSYFSYIRPP